jgi:hypothetical protein
MPNNFTNPRANANLHNRRSIEAIYPIEVFAVDAAANQKQPANELLKGVRILSAPDEAGYFEIARATMHVGEIGATFMVAHRTLCGLHAHAALYDRLKGTADIVMSRTGQIYALINPDPRGEYEAFIDAVIAEAPRIGFRRDASPGRGDVRLQGLRQ